MNISNSFYFVLHQRIENLKALIKADLDPSHQYVFRYIYYEVQQLLDNTKEWPKISEASAGAAAVAAEDLERYLAVFKEKYGVMSFN